MVLDTAQQGSTTLIILFTDLEGSTRLWQQCPQTMQTALARHDEIIQTAESCKLVANSRSSRNIAKRQA